VTTKVWIVEEYGYRHWVWEHPGTLADVVSDWQNGTCPVNFMGLREGVGYRGSCVEFRPSDDVWERAEAMVKDIDVDEMSENHPFVVAAVAMLEVENSHEAIMARHGFHATAHVHEHDDTALTADGVKYGPWWVETYPLVHVLEDHHGMDCTAAFKAVADGRVMVGGSVATDPMVTVTDVSTVAVTLN
jgi:hypothetical protein